MARTAAVLTAALLLCTAAAAAAAAPPPPPPPAPACSAPEDCNLNGACVGGACACVPPWRGATCGVLDVLPAAAPDGALYRRANTSSWCASALRDDATGLWHAVVAQMSGNCGLNSWQANSQLVHAVSAAGPAGPYVNDTLIRLPFSHNPKLARAPDGTYLIFHIGCGDNSTKRLGPCAHGVTPQPPPPPPQRFLNGGAGACLAPAGGAYPAWTSPQGWPLSPLALVADAAVCAANASLWSVEGGFVSAAWPSAAVNLDCDACAAGSPLKLLGQRATSASGLAFDAAAGVIRLTACAGMCVSNGGSGAHRPCGSAAEPTFATQLHAVACDAPDARGWSTAPAAPAAGGAAVGASARADPAARAADCGGGYTELLSAPSLDGPWTFETAFGPNATGSHPYFPASVDNPAPLFFPNGSVSVMFRSYTRASAQFHSSIGIARADSWRGPWTLPSVPVFAGLEEDPFLWYAEATQSYHALFHNMGGCGDVGCHAFSRDGWAWTLSPTPAYGFNVTFDDGSHTVFSRRERPQLVFDPAMGSPTHLINGVQLPRDEQPPGGQGDYTYSLIVPLRGGGPVAATGGGGGAGA